MRIWMPWMVLWLVTAGWVLAADGPAGVYVNGHPLRAATHTIHGVLYVPVFAVARLAGVHAEYDARTHHASLAGHRMAVEVRILDDAVYVPADSLIKAVHGRTSSSGGRVRLSIPLPKVAVQPAPVPTLAPVQGVHSELIPVPTIAPVPPLPIPSVALTFPSMPQNVPLGINGMSMPMTTPKTLVAPIDAPPSPPPDMAPVRPTPLPVPMVRPAPPMGLEYAPRVASNGTFSITVTNVMYLPEARSHYQPRAGYQFVMVSVSEQNVSDQAQVYTGRFVLQDNHGAQFEPADRLSTFWPVVLRPQGTNFGRLTFEIPRESSPQALLLYVPSQPTAAVSL